MTQAKQQFERLVDELRRRTPEAYYHLVESEAQSYIEKIGSVADALLYLEWVDRSRLVGPHDIEGYKALVSEITDRAKGDRLPQIIRSTFPDVIEA